MTSSPEPPDLDRVMDVYLAGVRTGVATVIGDASGDADLAEMVANSIADNLRNDPDAWPVAVQRAEMRMRGVDPGPTHRYVPFDTEEADL